MKSEMKVITRKSAVTSFLYTPLFCLMIAVFLTVMGIGKDFITNLIFSICIGLSTCSCVMLTLHFFQPARSAVCAILIAPALFIGTIVGSFIGSILAGLNPSILFEINNMFVQMLLLGAVFGSIISYFFISRERIAASEAQLKEEQIKRLTSEKKVSGSKPQITPGPDRAPFFVQHPFQCRESAGYRSAQRKIHAG